jgi:hypothetical protein
VRWIVGDTTSGEGKYILELRAQPRPVTRINRKVLIGVAAVMLLFIAGLVLVALQPSSGAARLGRRLFSGPLLRGRQRRGCGRQGAGCRAQRRARGNAGTP